jgi:hypothetical protein
VRYSSILRLVNKTSDVPQHEEDKQEHGPPDRSTPFEQNKMWRKSLVQKPSRDGATRTTVYGHFSTSGNTHSASLLGANKKAKAFATGPNKQMAMVRVDLINVSYEDLACTDMVMAEQ